MNIGTGILKIVATGVLLGGFSAGAAAGALTQVHGNVPAMVTKAKVTGHHNPNAKLNISIALKLNNTGQLQGFLRSLHDPSSPNFHKFLAKGEFAKAYGPTADQIQGVVGFLTSHGITVTAVSASGTRVHGTATTAVIESAFGVAINDYKLGTTTFYAPTTDPNLPEGVAVNVVAVMGLDDAVTLVPHNIQNLHPLPAGKGAGPSGYSPNQIAVAYDWPDITNPANGAGVTIAIATAFTYRKQDVEKFWSTYGLPGHVLTNVSIDGTTSVLNGETTLDIERSSSMAPGANIEVYEASTPAFVSFDDEFTKIADDDNAQVVTTSWGSAESDSLDPNTGHFVANSSIIAEHMSFQQMASQGQTVMAAAGDDGSADRAPGNDNADFPSSDPYVIAAGGTSLSLNGDSSINTEVAWSGAGGADSKLFAVPPYQGGFTNGACDDDHTADFPDDTTDTPNEAGDGCTGAGADSRQSSDLALDANPGTGYSIYYNGRWEVFGGTSFVAPQMAGFFANLVQQNSGGSLGSGPALVFCVAGDGNVATTFHDITSGSNGLFSAGAGWDHPTGWGSIDASALIADTLTSGCL